MTWSHKLLTTVTPNVNKAQQRPRLAYMGILCVKSVQQQSVAVGHSRTKVNICGESR